MLHRILSIGMALLLLLSTTSWTVGKHYCKGHLVAVSLFSHTNDCCATMDMGGDVELIEDAVSCCRDEIIVHDGQEDFSISFDDQSIGQPLFSGFESSCFSPFELHSERPAPHERYQPPIVFKDIHLLDQVFLI